MKILFTLLLVTALASCGQAPRLDRDLPFEGPGAPAAATDYGAGGELRITILDVGQGDGVLIEAPTGETLLVDAGPELSGIGSILPYLNVRGIGELTHVVLTHDHSDHTGGLYEILCGPDLEPGSSDDITVEGSVYVNRATEQEVGGSGYEWPSGAAPADRTPLHAGDIIELGDVDIEALASGGGLADGTEIDRGEPADENANSIVLLLSYSGFRMLLTGDITGGGGTPPYETPDVETCLAPLAGGIDVLKVAHHGSKTSTNQAFLDGTRPEVAIISVGDGNDHFHPHSSVIDRLLDSGIAVYQTERGWLDREEPVVADGHVTIEVDSDGDYRVILE